MAKAIIKADDFQDFVKRLNPFGVRNETGKMMVFSDYGKLYLHTLKLARQNFPLGFIDIPLFLHELTGLPLTEAKIFAKRLPFIKTENEVYLCEWPDEKSNPKYKAELLMRALHSLSETQFSVDYYGWAWEEFKRLFGNQL